MRIISFGGHRGPRSRRCRPNERQPPTGDVSAESGALAPFTPSPVCHEGGPVCPSANLGPQAHTSSHRLFSLYASLPTTIQTNISSGLHSRSRPLSQSISMVAAAPKNPTTTTIRKFWWYSTERLSPSINSAPTAPIAIKNRRHKEQGSVRSHRTELQENSATARRASAYGDASSPEGLSSPGTLASPSGAASASVPTAG